MIIDEIHYECVCAKCSHKWNTKTRNIPVHCPACKTKKWNEDSPDAGRIPLEFYWRDVLLQTLKDETTDLYWRSEHYVKTRLNHYYLDIGSPIVCLGIEIDGSGHTSPVQKARDDLRTDLLEEAGWAIMRFTPQEIMEDIHRCITKIRDILPHPNREHVAAFTPMPTSGPMNVIERGVMMEKFLSQSDGEPHVTVTSTQPDEWRFTKDKPQFADDGNVYRLQCLVSDPRKTRTVRVDELDHDEILSVNKKR